MTQKNVDNLDQAYSIGPIESANASRPKDEKTRKTIANMDAIDLPFCVFNI